MFYNSCSSNIFSARRSDFTTRQPAPLEDYDRVAIGDVGYIQRGHFVLLFRAAGEIGTRRLGIDVPEDFVPLEIGAVVRDQPRLPRTCLHTTYVRQLGTGVEVSADA